MNRFLLTFLIGLALNISGYSQKISYTLRNEVFRTFFEINTTEVSRLHGHINYSSSAMMAFDQPILAYEFGLGMSTFNFVHELDYSKLIILSPNDFLNSPSTFYIKVDKQRFLIVPFGIRYKIKDKGIYIPLHFAINVGLDNERKFYNKVFYTVNTGVGMSKSISDKLNISLEPTLNLYFHSIPGYVTQSNEKHYQFNRMLFSLGLCASITFGG